MTTEPGPEGGRKSIEEMLASRHINDLVARVALAMNIIIDRKEHPDVEPEVPSYVMFAVGLRAAMRDPERAVAIFAVLVSNLGPGAQQYLDDATDLILDGNGALAQGITFSDLEDTSLALRRATGDL